MTSRESSDEKDRQRQAARESHKKVSLVIARCCALKYMTMDLEKRGSRVLPALATALARPSASSSHRGTCRPRRRQRLRLPKPRCGGDCQHPCPSPSRLSGLFGVPGALDGEAYPNEKLLIAGLAVTAILVKGLNGTGNWRLVDFSLCTTKVPPKILPNFETSLSDRFRAPLVRWYSGHLTSRNFT